MTTNNDLKPHKWIISQCELRSPGISPYWAKLRKLAGLCSIRGSERRLGPFPSRDPCSLWLAAPSSVYKASRTAIVLASDLCFYCHVFFDAPHPNFPL